MSASTPDNAGNSAPEKPAPKLPVIIGFIAGAIPWAISCIPQQNYGAIPFLIFACFGMPLISVIAAIIPKTRRVGLGLLLASGLGWLILGAMCSGMFR